MLVLFTAVNMVNYLDRGIIPVRCPLPSYRLSTHTQRNLCAVLLLCGRVGDGDGP